MVPDWRPLKILSKPHVVFYIWCKTSGDMSLASCKVINLFFIFNHRSLREGGGGGGVSPSTEPLQTLHGTFLQVYKIENKVYCWNYNSKSEMPTLLWKIKPSTKYYEITMGITGPRGLFIIRFKANILLYIPSSGHFCVCVSPDPNLESRSNPSVPIHPRTFN